MQRSTSNCFQCGKVGHWVRDCPQKNGGAVEAPRPVVDSGFPDTHCRCGQGLCKILVSRSQKNPGRMYYHCPGSGPDDCKFFKWCNELRDEIRTVAPLEVFPICECRAGICSVVIKADGLSYFVCPINKGEGACNFSQLRNGQTDNNRYGEVYDPADPSEILPEEEVLAELEGWFGPAANNSGEIESPDIWENVECPDCLAKTGSASESSAGEELSAEVVTSPEVIQNPAPELRLVPFGMQTPGGISEAVVMENSPGSYPGKRSRPESTSNINSPNKRAMIRCHILEGSLSTEQGNSVTQNKKTLVRCLNFEHIPVCAEQHNNRIMMGVGIKALDQAAALLQKELIDLLCCMTPQDHLTMLKEAECTFSLLNLLQAEYQLFYDRVNSYIERAAALAEIEKCNIPSKEPTEQYKDAKSRVDELTDLHDKAKKAYSDSNIRVRELGETDGVDENKMLDLLCDKAVKAAELKNQLRSLSCQLCEAKRRLEVVSGEIANSVKEAEERDIELSAAKAAFEKAREQLFL